MLGSSSGSDKVTFTPVIVRLAAFADQPVLGPRTTPAAPSQRGASAARPYPVSLGFFLQSSARSHPRFPEQLARGGRDISLRGLSRQRSSPVTAVCRRAAVGALLELDKDVTR